MLQNNKGSDAEINGTTLKERDKVYKDRLMMTKWEKKQ
jgi:hypothetical protein